MDAKITIIPTAYGSEIYTIDVDIPAEIAQDDRIKFVRGKAKRILKNTPLIQSRAIVIFENKRIVISKKPAGRFQFEWEVTEQVIA